MNSETELQREMFAELRDKEIFEEAQKYTFNYLDTIFSRNVFPTEEALQNLEGFDEEFPENGSEAKAVLSTLQRLGSPATTATLGGRYFGFVTGSAVPVGLAAKQMATFWDQAPAMQVLSPVGSILESVVERWLVQLFGLPEETVAGFVSGTSSANLCGLAAARYRILKNQGWDINTKGLFGAPNIRIITGKHAHSTVLKAIAVLGIGQDAIEWVEVDDQGRIRTEAMPDLDPTCIVVLQAGNVNSGSFDDFQKVCKKAVQAGAWVHIDGAFGLWARASEPLKHLTYGMELAHSWAVDGHKTLNTPYDCGIILCADKEALRSSLHMSGSYLVTSEGRDGMFYTPEMSRRARVIELWAIMKYLGREGVDTMIYTMHLRARQFADAIRQVPGFYVENDVVFNQVIVRCDSDVLTQSVLRKIQELRDCWLGGSVWFGKAVMRVSICSWATTEEDIDIAVASFKKALELCRK